MTDNGKKKVKRRPVSARTVDKLVLPDGTQALTRPILGLRRAAMLDYVRSDNGITLAQLRAMPAYSKIGLVTLKSWHKADHWDDKRREWADAFLKRAQDRLGNEIIQARIRELRALESIKDALDKAGFAQNEDGSVILTLVPKSLESWAKVRLEYGEALDRLRGELAVYAVPQFSPIAQPSDDQAQERPTALHPNLRIKPTEEEALAMSKTLLQMRRAEIERKIEEHRLIHGEDVDLAPISRKKPPPTEGSGDEDEEDEEE